MNTLYTSKSIQNETIDVIGSAIEDQIIDEIQAAKFFTILADEVTDCSNLEQVSIVIRFVDGDNKVREDFLSFITVECITGESLATVLLSWLESHNTDVSFCRGQGYNGASTLQKLGYVIHTKNGMICHVTLSIPSSGMTFIPSWHKYEHQTTYSGMTFIPSWHKYEHQTTYSV